MLDLFTLDRHSVVPLYYQIRQDLLEDIRAGALKPGQLVPSEQEISARLGVCRMTARQALKSLCDLGIVYSERGNGTFVAPFKMEKSFRQVLSFTEEMGARGSRPGSRVLSLESVLPRAEIAAALQLAPKERVIRLWRVRLADSLPMGVECAYMPERMCPDLPQGFDGRTSLYRTLAEKYGIRIAITDEVAEAGLADSEVSRLLHIPKGSPVFIFTRTSRVHSGQPVEYVESVYRGDRYKIVNRLTSQPHRLGPAQRRRGANIARKFRASGSDV